MDTVGITVDTPRRKRPNRVTVTLHFVPGKDDDLLAILQAVPLGKRQEVLKKALRSNLGKAALAQPPVVLPTAELHTIQQKVDWIENALNDLPGYLAGVIRQVASQPAASTANEPQADPALLQDRTKKLLKRQW